VFGAMVLGALSTLGVPSSARRPAPDRASTVILVRHAEKDLDDPTDPGLTERGVRRAEALAKALAKAGVTKLYATEYRRTRATLQPLAELLGLPVERYAAGQCQAFAAKLRTVPGQVAVVAGHSNTVPVLVKELGGVLAELDERGFFGEDEYDRVVILTLWASGPDDPMRAIQTVELRLDP
jgi:phosphohistidine phosphatase SixA